MKNITVIKIGGATFGGGDTTIDDVVALQKKGELLVVVHGGGSTVTEWLARQEIKTQFIRGERVTDFPSLEIATAVLAGLVNKEIVASINLKGGKAVGISGLDGLLIESKVKNKEMGWVGSVEKVNKNILETLLKAGFIPIVSPISLLSLERTGDSPAFVNVNGDPIAGEIAAALGAKKLLFLTDVEGVRDKTGAVIPRIIAKEVETLIGAGVVSGGMIPKVNAASKALNSGALTRIIDGRQPHALLKEFDGPSGGTTISKG